MSRVMLKEEVIDTTLGLQYPNSQWLDGFKLKGETFVKHPYLPNFKIKVEENNIKNFIK